jgi:hypothetical protein
MAVTVVILVEMAASSSRTSYGTSTRLAIRQSNPRVANSSHILPCSLPKIPCCLENVV